MLHPEIEIILFGNEEGTTHIAKELGVQHLPDVECNESGTPLVNSIFEKAQSVANYPLLCYVNADIILPSDFVDVVEHLLKLNKKFLAIGYRYDVDLKRELDFQQPDWEVQLRNSVREKAPYPQTAGMDYFIFPYGLWDHIPQFALGRGFWDSWLVYRARYLKAPVINITPLAKVIHQNHDYSHFTKEEKEVWYGEESMKNYKLSGGIKHYFGFNDATHLLTNQGIQPAHHQKSLRQVVISLILFLEQSPYFFPGLKLMDALLKIREIARSILVGKPHERKLQIRDDYMRFE